MHTKLLLWVFAVGPTAIAQVNSCGPPPPRPAAAQYNTQPQCVCTQKGCFYQWVPPTPAIQPQSPLDTTIPLKGTNPPIQSPISPELMRQSVLTGIALENQGRAVEAGKQSQKQASNQADTLLEWMARAGESLARKDWGAFVLALSGAPIEESYKITIATVNPPKEYHASADDLERLKRWGVSDAYRGAVASINKQTKEPPPTQSDYNSTPSVRWTSYSTLDKMMYLQGYEEALFGYKALIAGPEGTMVEDQVLSEIYEMLPSFLNQQYMIREVDKLFTDKENVNLPIADALLIVTAAYNDMSPDQLRKLIEDRRTVANQK